MYTNDSINYCKPILIQVPEIFARFTRPLLSQTFLVANQSLPYGFYNNMDINTVRLHGQKLFAEN